MLTLFYMIVNSGCVLISLHLERVKKEVRIMTEFRNKEGKNVYVKDFGTDTLPVGSIVISNRTGAILVLKEIAGRVVPVSTQTRRGTR